MQQRLFRFKRDVVLLRARRAAAALGIDFLQEQPAFASPALAPYYRDVADHVIRVAELADNVRDLLTLDARGPRRAGREPAERGHEEAHVRGRRSSCVPTLIAGIYGMNFRHMPELRWQFGYPLALGIMVGAAVGLYVVFKKRGWL